MSSAPDLAVIGGSGLYRFPELEILERRELQTPWGAPSGPLVLGRLGEHRLVFLARHGEQHALAPHRVNYRANLWALQQTGVRRVVGVNAVGGIHQNMPPQALVVPDQLIDYTWGRACSYFDGEAPHGEVRHIDFSAPYSHRLRAQLLAAGQRTGMRLVDGGCYAATQGPRLETRAEIRRLQRDGCDLVGMTGMPEAVLARELELEYACVAVVANWAAGCGSAAESEISVEEIFAQLAQAMERLPELLRALPTSAD